MRIADDWIIPDWPAPGHVRAVVTTRNGGVSHGQYGSMNIATHVGDQPSDVARNRQRLSSRLDLPAQPAWLEQVHGTRVIDLDSDIDGWQADGSTSSRTGGVCVVMTADCLPVLLTNRRGSRVAALHAGWRGLAAGILESGVACFDDADDVIAWLGPAISVRQFEVGDEVVEQLGADRDFAADWYQAAERPGKWYVDIYRIAAHRLRAAGVAEITGGGFCTFSESDRFYSFRRQSRCGRMASLIWLDPGAVA